MRNSASGSSPMLSGRRGPSDHRWQRAGGATDDDVLLRCPLQPRRVHDDIEEDRARQAAPPPRGWSPKQEAATATTREDKSEDKRLDLRDLAAGNRPHRGASHDGIDIGVVPHVEGAGGAGARRDCENCDEGQGAWSRCVGAIIDPTSAVKTASAITRGFINVTKWGSRFTKLGREANERRDNGIAVVFMVIDSSSQRFVLVKTIISRSQESAASR